MSNFDRNPVATAKHFVAVDRMYARMYRGDALADQKMRCVYCKERITRFNATADHLRRASPTGIGGACAWVRFQLNRRTEKAERRICRAVGMVPL